MLKMRYRIIKDQFNGYEVQYKAWYNFSWKQWKINSFQSIASAERQVQLLRKAWHGKALPEVIKEWGE